MSKQLAISSAFATFAMACMALSMTSDHSAHSTGDGFIPMQVEVPNFDLPQPNLLP